MEPLQFLLPICILWYLRSLRGSTLFRWADCPMLLLPAGFIAARYQPSLMQYTLSSGLPVLSLAMWLSLALFSGMLLVPVAAEIARYRHDLKTIHSNLAGIDPGWLQALLISMGILFFIYAVLTVLLLHTSAEFPRSEVLGLLMGTLTVHLSWKSLGRRPHLAIPAAVPAADASVRDEDLAARAALVMEKLETSRLYLNPELNLDDLARAAGLTRHETSAALNKGLGVSFFDLVNRLRVDEFRRLCAEPSKRGEKILTLALDSGFNSKPAFNLIFRRMTGRTPSDFRKSLKIVS